MINIRTGEVKHSNINIPKGYDAFKNDITATQLLGAFDPIRQTFYLGFPYSDSLYLTKGRTLLESIYLPSTITYNYIPSEVISFGDGRTVWALPKEGSKHIFLIYDPYRDLFLRASKIKETGNGDTKFKRKKHYVLSIFNDNLEPLGEYFFDFNGELDLENWFLSKKGLFINKPEQISEDSYEFFQIDLSRFKHPKVE